MVRTCRYGCLLMAALLLSGSVWAAEPGSFEHLLLDDDDKPRSLTDEQKKLEEAKGYFLVCMQNCDDKAWDKAGEQLRKILLLNVSPDTALTLRDLATSRQVIQILAEAPDDTRMMFQRFLAIAEKGRRQWIKKQERIGQLVQQLVESDNEQMWMAVRELMLAGQYAAPQLVAKLLDERDREGRTRAVLALRHAGRSVTLPLAEALLGVNDHVKQDICYILRESPKGPLIPDRRALPALKTVAQDANVNRAAREEALRTILTILPGDPSLVPSAQEIYFREAERYYLREPSVTEPSYEDHIIWSWADGKLVPRVVPEYAYYLEMAEKYCRQALAIDPNYEKVKPLLVCVIYAQHTTVTELLAAAARNPQVGLTDDELKGLEARRERLDAIINTLPALGKKHFYAALQRATADGQTSVAVSCIEVLKKLGCGVELGPAAMAVRP